MLWLMMYSTVIVGITISHESFVFDQCCVKVSASLNDLGSLAVRAFDLLNHSLSANNDIAVHKETLR